MTLHLGGSTIHFISQHPGVAAVAVPSAVAASVVLLLAVAVLFGTDPIVRNRRLHLLPWRGRDRLLVASTLVSPFAVGAAVLSWLGLTWSGTVSLATDFGGSLLVAGILATTFIAAIAGARTLLLHVAPRAPSVMFWTAMAFALLVGSSMLRSEPAADLVTLAHTLGLAEYLTRLGPLNALGALGATLLVLLGGTAFIADRGQPLGLLPDITIRSRHRTRLSEKGTALFGPATWKELALLGRATLARNALFASAALAVMALWASAPFGMALIYLFSLQIAFNVLGFDLPLSGRERYQLLPSGLVRALHARETVMSGVTLAFGGVIAFGFALQRPQSLLIALAWLLLGQAMFSVALIFGRFTSIRWPKPLHVWQFFVHGGIISIAGYLGSAAALIITIGTAFTVHALLAAVVPGNTAPAVSISVAALMLGGLHWVTRRMERRVGRVLFTR
jgi:hypothetical protein